MANESPASAGDPSANAGGARPDFANPIGTFLDTYKRSMEGMFAQLGAAKGMHWNDPAQVLEWMKKTAAFPSAMPGADVAKAFAPPLDAAGLAGAMTGASTSNPLLAGIRHIFAGAHDAVGWGLYTQLAEAMTEVGRAEADAAAAQTQAWKLVGEIWETARSRFGEELKAMAGRGESFADVQAFLRAWTAVLDKAAHEALQREPGLAVSTSAMRAVSRLRAAQNRAVELVSEIYNVPTRAEVDEAYRMIHELRKEVRALRKRAD